MSTISFQAFSCMQQLDQEVERLENEVGHIESQLQLSLSSEDYYRLFQELDRALQPLKQMEKTASSLNSGSAFFFERLTALDERGRTLFGNLIAKAVDREVVEIQSEAMNLEKSLCTGNMRAIAQKVDALKQHISTFKHDHALSKREIVQISQVEKFIARIEKFLEIPSKLQQLHLNNFFNYGEMDPITAELLMEMFEAAEMYESGHSHAAKKKERLPPHVQKRLEAIVAELGESLDLPSDKLHACALLATALELSQGKQLDDALTAVAHYYEGWDELMASSRHS